MAAEYAWGFNNWVIIRAEDGATIPLDEGNADYQAYLAWAEAGGVPDPYEPPPPAPDVLMPGEIANMRLDAGVDAAADSVVGVRAKLLLMPSHSVPPTVEELQAQVDYLAAQTFELAEATRAMLEAQAATGQET